MAEFKNIIGHSKQLSKLSTTIKSGTLPQTFLFIGQKHIGKTTIAKELANILQCNNNCKNCSICTQIEKNGHSDTYIYDNIEESFKIDDIKKLQEKESQTSNSNYKIFIIKNAERMTTPAANSFLKTLEEPNEKTIFILTSSKPEKLLKTIISRTSVIKFQNIKKSEILKTVKKRFPEKTETDINNLFKYTNKTPGEIISLLKDVNKEDKFSKNIERFKIIIKNTTFSKKFKIIEELTKNKTDDEKAEHKADIKTILTLLTTHFREKLKKEPQNVKKNTNTLLKITQTGILLKQNVNTKITLENLMLEI